MRPAGRTVFAFLLLLTSSASLMKAEAPLPRLPDETRFLKIENLPPIDEIPLESVPPGDLSFSPSDILNVEEYVVTAEAPEKIWEGGFEFGTNGTSGNSQTFDLRFGTHLTREVPTSILTLDLTYNFGHSNSERTANRLFTEERWERLFPESPWSVFFHQTNEFDEFRAFDVRVTGDSGVSYKFFDSEVTKLSTRVGLGASTELGGPDDSVVPEGVWGLSYQRKITQRQKLKASFDYFPDITDPGDFRFNSRADWEILLDEVYDLTLKIGVIDRYDSTPGDALRNDVNYSAVILWSF